MISTLGNNSITKEKLSQDHITEVGNALLPPDLENDNSLRQQETESLNHHEQNQDSTSEISEMDSKINSGLDRTVENWPMEQSGTFTNQKKTTRFDEQDELAENSHLYNGLDPKFKFPASVKKSLENRKNSIDCKERVQIIRDRFKDIYRFYIGAGFIIFIFSSIKLYPYTRMYCDYYKNQGQPEKCNFLNHKNLDMFWNYKSEMLYDKVINKTRVKWTMKTEVLEFSLNQNWI